MSLLYNPTPTVKVELKQEKGKVKLYFEAACGKHFTDEALDAFSLTPERLLAILQEREDLTDEELDY